MNRLPELVIFDCDGVLVDSEPIFNRILAQTMTDHGLPMTYEQCCQNFVGKNMFAVDAFAKQLGAVLPADWVDHFYDKGFAALEKEVELIPDVEHVLNVLQSTNTQFCVASNGRMRKMEITLGKTGILPLFQNAMYSGYDVPNAKPEPDLFLHAAAQFSADPRECVVIEDSSTGMLAANRAGMRCFAYNPANDLTELHGATSFATMHALPKLLGFGS